MISHLLNQTNKISQDFLLYVPKQGTVGSGVCVYSSNLLTIQSASEQVLPLLYKCLQLLLIKLLPNEATEKVLKTLYYIYHIRRTIRLKTRSSFEIEESKAMMDVMTSKGIPAQ